MILSDMALLHSFCGLSTALSRSPDSPSLTGVRMPKKVAGFSISSSRVAVLSVGTFQSVRRPYLPRAGLLAKPTTLISERVICTDIQPGEKLEFRYAKQPSKDFCDFIETTPKSEIVAFFRDVAGELEGYRQLRDFHMKVRDGEGDFRVQVFFGDDRRGPEFSQDDECIACCPNANLFPGQEPGMEAGECILEGFSDQPYALCRLDAKGRSGFSITPVRHVEKMSDLDDEELFAMWSVAVRALRYANLPFISMILNHGTYRTLYHLHLKVWVENELHQLYRSTWSEERKELWNRLQELALNRPKKQQICFFFKKNNSCRHGDLCSFLHVN